MEARPRVPIMPFAAYRAYAETQHRNAVNWGHGKNHHPDLKQMQYILTISEDGGMLMYITSAKPEPLIAMPSSADNVTPVREIA